MKGSQARLDAFRPDTPQQTVERIQRKARRALNAADGDCLEVDR